MSTTKDLLTKLNSRPVPEWFEDAKFGIFIHWGPFAIPAFAENHSDINEVFKSEYDIAMARSPYSEWYLNAIKVPGTAARSYHAQVYGGRPYQEFKQPFVDGLEQWDPGAWAECFRKAGAKYVVLVTKHHDGFCLWPSAVQNLNEAEWFTKRDLVGELADAVRGAGMRFGIYYSGGIDWTFNPNPIRTLGEFIASVPGGDYPAYAMAQVDELIERYEPSVLWNDIAWPTGLPDLLEMFERYYDKVPDGVVNDRWIHLGGAMKFMKMDSVRKLFDWSTKRRLTKQTGAEGIVPPKVPHSGFRTPEYTRFDDIQSKKWEATRGMSHSFGFNRNDTEDSYERPEVLLETLIDAVSKNGNLLLNVGPRGDNGALPEEQLRRLTHMGTWLETNGDAIYGTRPWKTSACETACGVRVRFTCGGQTLNLIFLDRPSGETVRLKGVSINADDLADHSEINGVVRDRADTIVYLKRALSGDGPNVISIPIA